MARRLDPGRLVLATHNEGKRREFQALLAPFGIELLSAAALGLGEPEEVAPDFVGNARIKAVAAAREAGLPALADDSGFSVAALGGAPGVFSARWAGKSRDFVAAMARVERELGMEPDRRAWFSCALALTWPDEETATFLGRVEGMMAFPPRGSGGFGYDPIFVPRGETRTFAEMTEVEKARSSHRARALAQLVAACMT